MMMSKNEELLLERWDHDNNSVSDPLSVSKETLVNVICPKCGQSISRKIKHFLKSPDACNVCSGKIVIEGINDLASKQPLSVERWDYQQNSEFLPHEVSFGSGKKAWFKCTKCSQSILRKIADFYMNPVACSVCSGKIVVQGVNDFATLHSELLDEWDYAKNTKQPCEISETSKYKAWWKCKKCGNSWQRNTYDKIHQNGTLCGVCAGQVLLTGFNDVSIKLPEMAEEWDYEKNQLKPEEVIYNSTKKFHLLCIKCNHSYEQSPQQFWDRKNDRKRLCPKCLRTHQSYGEQELFEFCKSLDDSTISRYKFLGYGNKEIDIYLPQYKIGIEFNGDYWHSDKVIQEKYNMTAYEYHEQKKKLASDKDINLLFVWATDYYNDPKGVQEKIAQVILNNAIDPLFCKLQNDRTIP